MFNEPLSQKFVDSDRGKICYFFDNKFVDRPTVIFLHGLSANHTTWNNVVPFLEQEKLNALLVDLRGHGHSDKDKTKSNYKSEFSEFATDIDKIIKKENLSSFFVVGYSFGGFVAMNYASKYSDSLLGLVLISSNHVSPLKYWNVGFLIPLVSGSLNILAGLLSWQSRKKYHYYRHEVSLGYWQSTFVGYMTMPVSLIFWMLAEVVSMDFSGNLDKIICPTLIIKAQKDPFLSDKEVVDMISKIKKSKLVVLDENSHFLASKHQEKLFEHIKNFLTDLI